MTTVYRKTAKGQAEIETRIHRLPPRLRGALILIDGQRSALDLAKLIGGDVEAALQRLLADGFIDVFALLADPRSSSPPTAVTAVQESASLDRIKRDSVRMLTQHLGPLADQTAVQIERSQSLVELRPLLTLGAQMLRNFKGPEIADAFAARFLAVDVPT